MHINGQSQNETDNLATACYNMMKNMYKKEYSEMLNIFYGIHVSEIISNTTNETNANAADKVISNFFMFFYFFVKQLFDCKVVNSLRFD